MMRRKRLKSLLMYLKYTKIELIKKINTLELENENLKEELKNNIFDEVLKNYDKIQMNDNLKLENKNLRNKIKALKEKL